MENRFDELAKALAGGITRRETLQRVAGAFGGALLASLGLGKAALGAPAPNSTCEKFCRDTCGIAPGGGNAFGKCVSSCQQCLNAKPAGTVCACPPPGQTNVVCCSAGQDCNNGVCVTCATLEQCVTQSQLITSIIDDEGFKAQLLSLINNFRSANGLSTLARVQALEAVAQSHSDAMSSANFLTHLDPFSNTASVACQTACQNAQNQLKCLDDCTVNERIIAAGYSLPTGENLATGLTPQAVFNGWLGSQDHLTVLLTQGFNRIGLGLAVSCNNTSGVKLWWTADFGTNGPSTRVQPGPTINVQAEVSTLVGYLMAADAAYCRGDLDAFNRNFQAFADRWVELGLLRDCVLTESVYDCLTAVIAGLTLPSSECSCTSSCAYAGSYLNCRWFGS